MIKLIAVDMDGTFLDDQMNYNRAIFKKIYQCLKKSDIHFVVASSNQYYQLKSFFDAYQDELIYISENGAYIVDHKDEIFHTEISKKDVFTITKRLQQDPRIEICICGIKSTYLLNATTKFYNIYSNHYHHLEIIEDIIVKFTLCDPLNDSKEIHEHLSQDIQRIVKPASSAHCNIDLIDPKYNKGNAIELLCQKYNLTLDQCAAFGDSNNDIEMLKKENIVLLWKTLIKQLKILLISRSFQ